MAWKLISGLFNFQRNLCEKDSEEVSMLIWTNFDSFAITRDLEERRIGIAQICLRSIVFSFASGRL